MRLRCSPRQKRGVRALAAAGAVLHELVAAEAGEASTVTVVTTIQRTWMRESPRSGGPSTSAAVRLRNDEERVAEENDDEDADRRRERDEHGVVEDLLASPARCRSRRDRRAEEDRDERRRDRAQHDPDDEEPLPCPPLAAAAPLDHVQEAVHVADRLHRPAEAVHEAGGARDEALPAIVAGLARTEGERDRAVRRRQRARARSRTGSSRRRRPARSERGRPSAGTANVCDGWSGGRTATGLPSTSPLPTSPAVGQERVAQAARAVEVVDRHVDGRVRRQRADGRPHPLPGVFDEVRDPVRMSARASARRPRPSAASG